MVTAMIRMVPLRVCTFLCLWIFLSGSGYQAGQTISSCSGCLHFNCTSRPSPDFDRSSFKMFWQLASVSADCCQNQEGQVFPLNQEMEKERVDEECGATEVAKCVRRDGKNTKPYTDIIIHNNV